MKINDFYLNTLEKNISILMITNDKYEKEIVIKQIINFLKTKINSFIIFCSNKNSYKNVIDDSCIYYGYDHEKIIDLTRSQYIKTQFTKQKLFLLLDDCFTFDKYKHDVFFNNLVFNNTSYNISYILTTDNPNVTMDYISTMDYVFLFNSNDKKLLHNNYCENLDFTLFNNIFNEIISNNSCMVITKNNNIYKYRFGETKPKISDKQNVFCNIQIFIS